VTAADRVRSLDPAHFSALWEACTRCFYLSIVSGFPRPRTEPPAAVRAIVERLSADLAGRRTETVAPGMPAGVLEAGGCKVQSAPLDVQVPEGILRCVLQGTLDLMVRRDDGAVAIVELALAEPDATELSAVTRRLHAYAHAVERQSPVSGLGLLRFEPDAAASDATGAVTLTGQLEWRDIARDEPGFFGFLAEALTLLDRPLPPPGTALCPWCVYRDVSRRTGL